MNTIEALEKRRSIRGYTSQVVEYEKIKTILKYGNKAPNGGPFHMSVIRNTDILNSIDYIVLNIMKNSDNEFMKQRASIPGYKVLYGAPVLIVLSVPNEVGNSNISAGNAVTNMGIAATELGLGSCYVLGAMLAFKAKPELMKQVGIPNGYIPQCGMLLGYESPNQIPGKPWVEDYSNINFVD